MPLRKYLAIPDCHVPYEDGNSFDLMLRAAHSAKANNVVVLGDFIDCLAVSSYPRPPDRGLDLAIEIEAARRRLDQIESICTGDKIYVSGNHEDRLQRYLSEKAPALFNTVKIDRLLGLADRGWKYVPYRHHTKIGKLFVTHDTGRCGTNAHRESLNAFQGNVLIGHTHRIGYAVEGNARGKPHVGAMLGWLGDVNQVDWKHRIRALREWALGFGIIYVEDDGCAHITPIPIVNGKCVVEGKLIK